MSNDFIHIDINRTGSSSVRKALDIQDEPMHLPVFQYDPEKLSSSFVFTVVRHPYERAISQFLHRKHIDGWDDFETWFKFVHIEKLYNPKPEKPYREHLFWPQEQFIYHHELERHVADYVGYFHRLEEHFEIISEKLTGEPKELPHTGKLSPSKRKIQPYCEYLTHKSKMMIDEVFDADFRTFGFEKDVTRDGKFSRRFFEADPIS